MQKNFCLFILTIAGLLILNHVNAQYCTPNVGSNWGRNEHVITTGGSININNYTGSQTGVHNFTGSDSIKIRRNETFTLICNHSYSRGVWIDWNNDGDFNDVSEAIDVPKQYHGGSLTTSSINVTVPFAAKSGSLRMRILQGYYWMMEPCGFSTYTGDVEDYTVHVDKPEQRDVEVTNLALNTTCPGLKDVKLKITNRGSDTLSSITLRGKIGTSTFGPTVFTGLNLALNQDTILKLGSFNFKAKTAYNIKFHSNAPNGLSDQYTLNDTLHFPSYKMALSGAYSVGSKNADYASIQTAIHYIEEHGVCGPVVFNLAQETFNEQVSIGFINGSSKTNTITIQSDSSNSKKAIWEYNNPANSSLSNYTVEFNGASHININNLTLKAMNKTYGQVVHFKGINNFISFDNDSIIGPVTHSSSSQMALIYDEKGEQHLANDITIKNSVLLNGSYSIFAVGVNTDQVQYRWTIENSKILDWTYKGIFCEYGESYLIHKNIIIDKDSGHCCGPTPIYLYYNYSTDVTNNYCRANGTTYSYGIYYYQCASKGSSPNYVSNNVVCLPQKNVSGAQYGMFLYYANSCHIVHNSVFVVSGKDGTAGVRLEYGSNVTFQNNAIENLGKGYALQSIGTQDYKDYNVCYAPNGQAFSSQKGQHSLDANPEFKSSTDLHSSSPNLHKKGLMHSKIRTDFEGKNRHSTHPCIGAYEFILLSKDEALKNTIVKYYPNPNSGSFYYELNGFEGLDIQVTISSLNGQTIYHDTWQKVSNFHSGQIETKAFTSGIYFIDLRTEKGSVMHRITINH